MTIQVTDKDNTGKVFWRDLTVDGKTVSSIDFARRFVGYYSNLFIENVQLRESK